MRHDRFGLVICDTLPRPVDHVADQPRRRTTGSRAYFVVRDASEPFEPVKAAAELTALRQLRKPRRMPTSKQERARPRRAEAESTLLSLHADRPMSQY